VNQNLRAEKASDFRQRGQVILSALINEHFLSGEPVGSKILGKICQCFGFELGYDSQLMGELEDLGLLEQPHTSAGRVPTIGLRFLR